MHTHIEYVKVDMIDMEEPTKLRWKYFDEPKFVSSKFSIPQNEKNKHFYIKKLKNTIDFYIFIYEYHITRFAKNLAPLDVYSYHN